jgi:hypothetical protein
MLVKLAPCEISDEGGDVECDDDQAEEAWPEADVQPEVHVVKLKN